MTRNQQQGILSLFTLRPLWLTMVAVYSFTLPCLTQTKDTCRCCELGRIYAPYLKELPPPKKRDNIGNSHLKITTSSPTAQQWFDQGLNLLHAFWEFEAYRCFLQAAKADPECVMAYWGICMSLPGKNPESAKERSAALAKAKALINQENNQVSDHEKLYVDMVETLIHQGSKAATIKLRGIIKQYPQDTEAIAFLALWLRDGYTPSGKPKSGTREAETLLTKALKKHPKHTGLNHYYIHVLEQGPDFEKARQAAIALPVAAPGAGHLVHMPGHIYYLAGEYEKACQAFRACHQIESTYLKDEKIPPIDNNNYLHNLHFIAYAAADQGRYREALKAAALLARVKIPRGREQAVGAHQIDYLSNTITALVHMRSGRYDLAAASLLPDNVPANSGARHYILFLRSYCRLRHAITHPQQLNNDAIINREKLALGNHLRSLKASKPTASSAYQPWAQAHTACNILINEARAWLDNAQPKTPFKTTWASIAIRACNRSSYTEPPLLITPVEESLGWLALQNGTPDQARAYFSASLKKRRNCGHAYLGIARSYRAEKNTEKAVQYYSRFLSAFAKSDSNLPALIEAKAFIADHQPETSSP